MAEQVRLKDAGAPEEMNGRSRQSSQAPPGANFDRFESHTGVVAGLVPATPNF
ncbi:MAG TPA: hypothetical protein VNO18_25990 [Xanthobacteraceae bacterium]|jgi:hypothetical protein|nr:hypothetical protein [Xanthobacteraceae bacterium]